MSTKTVEKQTLPVSSMGNQRELTIIRYGSGSVGEKAYLQAGLHADEAPGYLVMHHLINLLDAADAAGTGQSQMTQMVSAMDTMSSPQWSRNHPWRNSAGSRGQPHWRRPMAGRSPEGAFRFF